ncbi:hypothetical protein [Rathayibacter sp. VKM Ac-2926]|uniref:hypothetical protein n=1 Tax=Rathayibacter sp. VKM Ac-2926 TaxID=2929477 RepID=UPI001FB2AEB7|nr:hypothetical protein [Rathayibacter sp. VKM Ac-2926]MCJ1702943.1 hypothetical protein [Rathayibacter sp. VKM Ac-2926]
MPSRFALVLTDLRSSLRWPQALLGAILVLGPTALGLAEVGGGVYRDELDVYSQFMISPMIILFPVFITTACCSGTAAEIRNRFVVLVRARTDLRSYLATRMMSVALGGFVLGFVAALLPGLIAFGIWPELGAPFIDPVVYGLAPDEVERNALERVNYSQLLAFGWPVYLIGYSSVLGAWGAITAVAGVLALVALKNLGLAMVLPAVIFFVETMAVALVDHPLLGFMYGAFPFGLDQAPIGIMVLPLAVAGAATVLAARRVLGRAQRLPALT